MFQPAADENPSPHASPRLWVQAGQRRPRHAGLAALPRAQEHSAHGQVHRNGARQVQRFLEGLTMTGADDSRTSTSTGTKPRSSFRSAFLIWLSSPAGGRTAKIVPFEEDDAPYRRDHSPVGGRILRGMRSLGPTAVSASSISRFLGLGACAVAAAGSIVPSITL